MPAKLLILAALVLILLNLFRALYALVQHNGAANDRVARSLTVRVALSIALFAALVLSAHWGWIPMHAVGR